MRDPRIEQTPVDKLLDEIQRLRDENNRLSSENLELYDRRMETVAMCEELREENKQLKRALDTLKELAKCAH